MKIEVWKEEAYPVYTVSRENLVQPVEVSQEFLDRYDKIEAEYQAMQQELAKLY